MNRLVLVLAFVVLVCTPAARADNFVNVTFDPVTFAPMTDATHVFGTETIGLSFTWDTTTQVLSDITVFATGPWWNGISEIPGTLALDSQNPDGSIDRFDIFSPTGDLFQENIGNHGGLFGAILSTPGTYRTDLFFFCAECVLNAQDFKPGTATVTPVTEPGTLALVSLGLVGFFARKRKKPSISADWEPLA